MVAAGICVLSSGTDFQTGYFSVGYASAYRLNPAFHPDYSFVSLPALGASSVSFQSDLGLGNLLYPRNGELVTFLHPDISADEFLGSLDKRFNKISVDASTNIFAIGLKKGDIYNIIDLSIRASVDGAVPYDLFRFLKTGTSQCGSYDLSGLRVQATSYAELGFASSYKKGRLTIGTKLKGLLGLADFNARLDKLNASFDGRQWSVSAVGRLTGAYDGIKVKTTESMAGNYSDIIDFGGSEYSARLGVNGIGVAADFGLKYELDRLELSASLTDIGMMWWFNNVRGYTNNKWTFEGKKNIPVSGDGSSIGDEISDASDELVEVFQFRKRSGRNEFRMVPFTARLGARYRVADPLSIGLMGSYRYSSVVPVVDGRASLAYNPFNCLELVASCGIGTYGFATGAMLNVRIPFVTLTLGADNLLIGKFSPQGFPICNFNGGFIFGVNVTW